MPRWQALKRLRPPGFAKRKAFASLLGEPHARLVATVDMAQSIRTFLRRLILRFSEHRWLI